MTDRELDQILGSEPEVLPSKTFAGSVMRSVRREATTPPPLAFPWLCLVPAAFVFGLVLAVLIAVPLAESNEPAEPVLGFEWLDLSLLGTWTGAWLQSLIGLLNSMAVGWIAAALLLTVACVVVPLRLVRGRR
jgi:hypothetical protein